MSRPPEPSKYSRTDLIDTNPDGSLNPLEIADRILRSSRSYRNDHCAVFIDPGFAESFIRDSGLEVDHLEPQENWHWTGIHARRKLKRIIIGDYSDWFQWFMKWQRFNAFQIVVLLKPLTYLEECKTRGYLDGLLARLIAKPSVHRVIVVEEDRKSPLAKAWLGEGGLDSGQLFGKTQFREAVASILYGTRLSQRTLYQIAGRTLCSRSNSDWETILDDLRRRPGLVERVTSSIYAAGYHAKEMVESLETEETRKSVDNSEEPLPAKFHQADSKGPSELSYDWQFELTRLLLKSQGWLTIPILYDFVQAETQKVTQSSETFPKIFNEHYDFEVPSEKHVFLPDRSLLRSIADRLVAEGKLERATWTREIGRPSVIYYESGRLPFDRENQCGQCAFYVPIKRQCRIWLLLNHAYRTWHPRWAKNGEHPLTAFEIHKMKNSWRIGPHSSACTRYLDKKRDHSLKAVPETCDTCGNPLKGSLKASSLVCENCRTRYYTWKDNKVKVLTAYEHEFRARYKELAGVDPSADLTRLIEERQSFTPAVVEQAIYERRRLSGAENPDLSPKTIVLYPGDNLFVREGVMYVFKKRTVEALPVSGSTLIDHGEVVKEEQRADLESAGMTVRSVPNSAFASSMTRGPGRFDISKVVEGVVANNPEFVRRMATAMSQSAIHATLRLSEVAEVREDNIELSSRRQKLWLRRLQAERPSRFLVCEAAIMREYWDCYYGPIKGAFQRSGPRKKARFVREFVSDPAGRARGYTAVDAAINFLHQRRLLRARLDNLGLGLAFNPGEGFLHRKNWNPEGLGLVLDLIDPFKFADREKLLGAILDFSLNWRDFYSATDRHGIRFYYPKEEAAGVLEGVGEAADRMVVSYDGRNINLSEAYRQTTSALLDCLRNETVASFTPFVY